jgi:hypothetical protein
MIALRVASIALARVSLVVIMHHRNDACKVNVNGRCLGCHFLGIVQS